MITNKSGFAFLTLLFSNIAFAHIPYFENNNNSADNPFVINTKPELSIAIYGNFDIENKVDYYKFKISSEQLQNAAEHRIKLHVGSLVPRCSPYQNIYPSIALLGPEQNSLPSNIESGNLPFSIPNGSGITVFNMPVLLDRDTTKFYEEHSKKWYWWGIKQDVYVDVPGEYMITIWESQTLAGDYVLEFGDEEQWNAQAILRAIVAMPKLLLNLEIENQQCRDQVNNFNSF